MNIEHAYILYHDKPKPVKYMTECKESCDKFNIPVTPFRGFSVQEVTAQKILDQWGLKVYPDLDKFIKENPEQGTTLYQETLCSAGHVAMWKEMIKNNHHAAAFFEHDVIVKRNFLDIDVEDDEIVYLGYRVAYEEDYECLPDTWVKYNIPMFGGTHAYALNLNTAKRLVNTLEQKPYLPTEKSIDWWLGHNFFNLTMKIVDPVPVVSVNCGRDSSIKHMFNNVANYNMPTSNGNFPPKFLEGIVHPERYYIDSARNWFMFEKGFSYD